MKLKVLLCLVVGVGTHHGNAISPKMDFGEPPPVLFNEEPAFVVTNSTIVPAQSKPDEEDIVHTIVVSTKVKSNGMKRGFTSNGDTDGTLTYTVGKKQNQNKDDSGEVPVLKSYKSVETTEIKTPDTRYKSNIYPDSIFVNRNIRDEGDVYPNVAVYPLNWKPANFYKNINYRDQDYTGRDPYYMSRRKRPNQANINKRISEEAQKEFYCKKCAELSGVQVSRGCGIQQRSPIVPSFKPSPPDYNNPNANVWYETTTQKMKIDGKLAKLN